jgi:hypothetical protein
MIRVMVESPYAGDVRRNLWYARAIMRECLHKDEAPFLSHALYTQPNVLRDRCSYERQMGIEAGFAFREACEKTVVYTDLGFSTGMVHGVEHAARAGHKIEYRQLSSFAKRFKRRFGYEFKKEK